MPATTAKGAATRSRIVQTAADLVLERGVGGTSLDDIRAGTGTSKSQLFHYFPAGKAELVEAIAAFQSERVLEAQRPHLDELDSLESWERWRDAVLAHYGAQKHLACPISALTMEAGVDASAHMERWQASIEAGVRRMGVDDDGRTALAIFAALQGGLLLMRASQSLEPLRAALDGALVILRERAAPSR
ncbi:TetR/AcrR family transcriptional regulator [Solirubrobacter phytolaccae]|uniref:TetR/AcrR family transcriptional regulator n=1 Tax=Solirubrobacter phytolaccae TaxID=1404360 RepID=A0A9X3NDY1_9ACTN|nr:TetR/AcrR family transcriptional regulator [Solirubrobacter phytolaccae]MDA0184678.1 TetR/AcrR family transcriptional regulator [Solirubrobacter phytolaccae]